MDAIWGTCKLARLCQHAIAFSIAGSQSERGERWRARPFLTKTRPLPEVRIMADAYSTERERSPLEIIRTALRAQRDRTVMQLGHAYALVRQIGDMDATRVDEFVRALLDAGEAEQIDLVLDQLDVASGAWRELADLADRVIEGVAGALTCAVLSRVGRVEAQRMMAPLEKSN
jgi:hypothetical protein